MLVLRLARMGRKKLPMYRLLVADSRRAATGKFVARLGTYNPHTKELTLDKEQVETFLQNGAQPSSTVAKLLKRENITMPSWAERNLVVKPEKKKAASEEEAETQNQSESEVQKEANEESSAKASEQADSSDDKQSEPAEDKDAAAQNETPAK